VSRHKLYEVASPIPVHTPALAQYIVETYLLELSEWDSRDDIHRHGYPHA